MYLPFSGKVSFKSDKCVVAFSWLPLAVQAGKAYTATDLCDGQALTCTRYPDLEGGIRTSHVFFPSRWRYDASVVSRTREGRWLPVYR